MQKLQFGAEISGGSSQTPLLPCQLFHTSRIPGSHNQLLQLLLCRLIVPAPHILEFLKHAATYAAAQHLQIVNTDPPEECTNIAVKVA